MTSVIPVHSVLRAIALACSGSNPARRRTSRVTSVARSAASFRFSCSSSNCAAAECARSTLTRDSSSPCSWAHHGASGSTFASISPQTCSATPSSRSSLLRKCQYRAIGIWAAVGALALATGPALGGLISQHLHWGWIFLINVPIGVVTFAIAMFYVAESRSESAARQLDLPGLATSALSLFALTYALIEGNVSGWTSPRILGAFALAAAAAGIFLAVEARSANPMVDLKMFRRREFSGGTGTMMIWAFGILGIYFFTSLYLQQTLGFSPVEAGLAFVPMALCVAVFASIAPRIEARAGAHRTVAAGDAAHGHRPDGGRRRGRLPDPAPAGARSVLRAHRGRRGAHHGR